MRHGRAVVGALVLSACSPNSLSGPLAFPVNGEFATVGTTTDLPFAPPFPDGTAGVGVFLVGLALDGNCSFYFFGEGANGGPILQFDRVLIGVSPDSSGDQAAPGTYPVLDPSDAGPSSAVIWFATAAGAGASGVGGSVTLTHVADIVAGSFSTTVEGTSLSGSFSASVCTP